MARVKRTPAGRRQAVDPKLVRKLIRAAAAQPKPAAARCCRRGCAPGGWRRGSMHSRACRLTPSDSRPWQLLAMVTEAVDGAPGDVIHNVGYLRDVCKIVKGHCHRDKAQFMRFWSPLRPASPLRLPGQQNQLTLHWIEEHNDEIVEQEQESNEAWNYAFSCIAGVVVMVAGEDRRLGASVLHCGVAADPEHPEQAYLDVELEDMDNRLAARILALGLMATIYDLCQTSEDNLTDVCGDLWTTVQGLVSE